MDRSTRRLSPALLLLALSLSGLGCTTGEDTTTEVFTGPPTTAPPVTTTTTTTAGTAGTDGTTRPEETTDATGVHETDSPTTGSLEPSCDDGEINQDETDVDCGGTICEPCPDGSACVENSDCADNSCVGNTCVVPACDDGAMNGDETDVDCGGGTCDPCADNLGCLENSDCESGSCAGSFCAAPSCGDGVMNGDETDVDCGGSCDGCEEAEMCLVNEDCLSVFCVDGACAPADCQTDADCGEFTTDCTTGVCTPEKTCEAQAANEGGVCDDGELCTTGEVCTAGACGGGAPVDCTMLNDDCNVGVCNPDDGTCEQEVANEGNPCDDNNACSSGETCQAGACMGGDSYVFHDNFADNSQGWSLGTEWQIGSAVAGCGDPGTDHTPTNDNGVAGVVLGGCATTSLHDYYCATSPVINTTGLDTVWLTYWRDLYSDYTPYMKNKIEVFNGNTWIIVFETAGAPGVNDSQWTEFNYELTSYSNANLQVRWCHNIGSGGAFSRGSWNIDDVTVGPTQCTP